jgi:hypothetical protein
MREVRNSTPLRTAIGGIVGGVVDRVVARPLRRRGRSQLLSAVTVCAGEWQWPVVPGVTAHSAGAYGGAVHCGCPRPDCPTPGAHPHDPPLLAASTDLRMVRWWWQRRPDAPVVVATGSVVSAVSLPLAAGERALAYFDTMGVRTGPVIATPSRCVLLVAPYAMQELAELLIAQEWVPTSLRFHGSGGYVLLPPSRTGAGALRWLREPALPPEDAATGGRTPWLPTVGALVEALVAASVAAPDGARLAY